MKFELEPLIIVVVVAVVLLFCLGKSESPTPQTQTTAWINPDTTGTLVEYDTTVVSGPVRASIKFQQHRATQQGRFQYRFQERRVLRREVGFGWGTDGLTAEAGVMYGNVGAAVIGSSERIAIVGKIQF